MNSFWSGFEKQASETKQTLKDVAYGAGSGALGGAVAHLATKTLLPRFAYKGDGKKMLAAGAAIGGGTAVAKHLLGHKKKD